VCDTWSPALRETRRLAVLDFRVLPRCSFNLHPAMMLHVVGWYFSFRCFETTYRSHLQRSSTPVRSAWPLKSGLIYCSETSVTNYQIARRNIREEQRPWLVEMLECRIWYIWLRMETSFSLSLTGEWIFRYKKRGVFSTVWVLASHKRLRLTEFHSLYASYDSRTVLNMSKLGP
jgi:hypothetical protein